MKERTNELLLYIAILTSSLMSTKHFIYISRKSRSDLLGATWLLDIVSSTSVLKLFQSPQISVLFSKIVTRLGLTDGWARLFFLLTLEGNRSFTMFDCIFRLLFLKVLRVLFEAEVEACGGRRLDF